MDSWKPMCPTIEPSAMPALELLHGGADALARHDGGPERREVVDARGLDAVDAQAGRGERDGQRVEDEARVHSGAEHAHAVLAGERVDPLGPRRVGRPRIRERLGDADDVGLGLNRPPRPGR